MPTACALCGTRDGPVSTGLSVCRDCIIEHPTAAQQIVSLRRAALRRKLGLPASPPVTPGGIVCKRCHNRCRIAPREVGFCGVRRHEGGRLIGGDPTGATVHWYRDPLPTNCVADWVCGERDATRGHNLAVFYYGCSFDCLFCQNWQHKQWPNGHAARSAEELAAAVRPDTACICYFGGDPTPHLPHSLEAAELARTRHNVRICWETNGSMERPLLEQMMHLALETGGTIKVDLKAFDPTIHRALCGVPNARVLETVAFLAKSRRQRRFPPILVVSTLLIPGYVTPDEVAAIASFLATLGVDIPYRLLCFSPQYAMSDLPTTSVDHARGALAAAKAAGLTSVSAGNVHLIA